MAHAGSPKSGRRRDAQDRISWSRFVRSAGADKEPVLTLGGGCNEVQRDMIAMAGLGLPRRR